MSTKLSLQFSIHNIVLTYNKENDIQQTYYNTKSNRFLLVLFFFQYEIYTDKGWNFEPSILLQHEEKTNDSAMDLNFKIYRLIKDGRLWLGGSYRQNKISIALNDGIKMVNQKYEHFTPIMGLEFYKNEVLVSVHHYFGRSGVCQLRYSLYRDLVFNFRQYSKFHMEIYPFRLASKYSLFILAIFSKKSLWDIQLHAPVFVQLPKPSSSICFTIFNTRSVASTFPWGKRAY